MVTAVLEKNIHLTRKENNLMLQIDKYAIMNGWHHIHPLEKIIFSFSFLLFTILTKSIIIALITFFVMSVSILYGAKIPLRYYVKLLTLPLIFLLTSLLVMIMSIVPIESNIQGFLWQIELGEWQLFVSPNGLYQAVQIFFTVMASVSCMYFFILTTPIHQITWLLQKLKLPTLFIELLVFIYRFIFVLFEKMTEIYLAQSSRLGYQKYRLWLTSLGQLIVSLLIKSMQSAKELQIALDSRAGEEGLHEIELTHTYKKKHWIGISISNVFLFAIFNLLEIVIKV
ncbi:cobalt/nickel transport system permease protein [Halalkalibacter nanhaiisediminis]|uniref:Cobalt/nickel transport system permease protein n=2 Tax=Halalkalibacter nanhaiisediminis TaxID=688079 RepID=A0A562QQJ4_9BACI|nr:cobalt/nickel transport system permease protein [Halalkalibacter nanhaiisediminis]